MTKKDYLAQIDRVIAEGKYRDDWQSLSGHRTPDWYYKGKFGIFIHWGIYSVPAFRGEWYSRWMYDADSDEYAFHKKTFGDPKEFGYKDFIPLFRAENFHAEEWAALFAEAGAKFFMPVAEHHDGFAMYDTDFNRWNAVKMGPCRDVLGELKAAGEAKGLTFCTSSHRAEHYFFMNMGRTLDCDVNDETYRDFYGPACYRPDLAGKALFATTSDPMAVSPSVEWLEDWLVRTCELIDRYRPKSVYFDWWILNQAFKPYLKKFCAYYYNRAEEWGEQVTINYKHDAIAPTVATFDVERGALTDISPFPWQTDTSVSTRSWGYIRDDEFKSVRQVVGDLVDVVSKNGMLLLNIGPKPDGTIPPEAQSVLRGIGAWLKVNGEGIYDTVPWQKFGEGEVNNDGGYFSDGHEKPFTDRDFRFTYKDGAVYAFCMRPSGRTVTIRSFAKKGSHVLIDRVEALGDNVVESVERDENGLTVELREAPATDLPIGFKIVLA